MSQVANMQNVDRLVQDATELLKNPGVLHQVAERTKDLIVLQSDDVTTWIMPTNSTAPAINSLICAIQLLIKSTTCDAVEIPPNPTEPPGEVLMSEFVWFVSCCKCGNQYTPCSEFRAPRSIYDMYAGRLDSKLTAFNDILDDYLRLFDDYCNTNYGETAL